MDCHVVTQSQTELKWGENSTQWVEFQIWKHDQAETKPRKPRAENQNAGGGNQPVQVGSAFANVFNYICQLSMNMLAACKYK